MQRGRATATIVGTILAATALIPMPAAAHGMTRGTPVVGAVGVRRTTEQLEAAAAEVTARVSSAPVRLGRADKTVNPDSPAGSWSSAAISVSEQAVTNDLSFDGPTSENDVFPPDTQGDVGPTQFLVTLNSRLRTYDKATGAADGAIDITPDTFWASAMTPVGMGGCNFTSDPHIRYDRLSGRWIAVMIDVPNCDGSLPNRIMIAVSDGDTLDGSTVWTFFHVDAPAGRFYDYPTLGIDANALYIGVNDFPLIGMTNRTDGFVVRKSSVLGPGPIVSTSFTGLAVGTGAGPFTPQGVDDPSGVATSGYFVGVDNALFGTLDLRRVTDPGGTPSISGNIQLDVSATTFPSLVPHLGNTGGNNGRLDALDDRLFAATMSSDGHIWTAHNIQVNASGAASASGGRDGSRWYEIDPGSGTTPTLVQSGTVFDATATNPRSYWIPTVAVSGQGIMVIGGSTAGATHHADAWFASRGPGDPLGSLDAPTSSTGSAFAYNPPGDPGSVAGRRWGDYSLTRVDPQDDQTFWTIQEYTQAANTWGVRISRLLAPPPATPTSTSGTIAIGKGSVHVTVTGTSSAGSGWYDPGAGYPQRLEVSVGCGVTVNDVGFTSPTSLDLDLDTSAATAGICLVTTTNPDGQQTSAAVLRTAAFRPDGKLSVSRHGPFIGDDVYNHTGAGQGIAAKQTRGSKRTFFLREQNDANVADSFLVRGPGGQPGFSVRYFAATTDVTAKVKAGTYKTGKLAPGAVKALRLVVTVKAGATIGSARSWLVVATSNHDAGRKDAVKATVRVIAG